MPRYVQSASVLGQPLSSWPAFDWFITRMKLSPNKDGTEDHHTGISEKAIRLGIM